MGRRWLVAAAVVVALVMVVAGVFVTVAVVREVREITADPCQPEEPRLLEAEAVHQRPPTGATTSGPASVEQPCNANDNSVTSGSYSVEYTSTLTDEAIRRHYEAVARDSGWKLKPDPSGDQFRLVYAEKWVRDRCLELSVNRGHAGDEGEGDYTVWITFWPRHHRSFCDAPWL